MGVFCVVFFVPKDVKIFKQPKNGLPERHKGRFIKYILSQ